MHTRDRILETALTMFASGGFQAASIRNIAQAVGIKESTVYYHFKSKRDILDCLLLRFEQHVQALLALLPAAPGKRTQTLSLPWIDTIFFERYLFDPFCNRMLRLMLVEQLHDAGIAEAYERWLFTEPQRLRRSIFLLLSDYAGLPAETALRMGDDFHAHITTLSFQYLLHGDLSEEKKSAFLREAHSCIERIFQDRGVDIHV